MLQLDGDNQPWALQARLTAYVKTKNFEQALEIASKSGKQFAFEHAYVLHRLGRNKEALEVLKGA